MNTLTLTDAVPQACIIHLTGHSAFQIIYCMESAANVLNAAQPVSIYRKDSVPLHSFGHDVSYVEN